MRQGTARRAFFGAPLRQEIDTDHNFGYDELDAGVDG